MEAPLNITPFSIHIEPEILSDLRERIRKTRWPDQAPSAAWEQGTDLEYLRQLLEYWADEFDWQAQERELNAAISSAPSSTVCTSTSSMSGPDTGTVFR